MNILIVNGSGSIGSSIVNKLNDTDAKVIYTTNQSDSKILMVAFIGSMKGKNQSLACMK